MSPNKDPINYEHERVLVHLRKIVLNNEDTPNFVPRLVSLYLEQKEIELKDNFRSNKIINQIRFVCETYDKVTEPKTNPTYLILRGLTHGNSLDDILGPFEGS